MSLGRSDFAIFLWASNDSDIHEYSTHQSPTSPCKKNDKDFSLYFLKQIESSDYEINFYNEI